MSQKIDEKSLVIPSGFKMHVENDGVVIGNEGNVFIEGKLNLKVTTLFSRDGSVFLNSKESVSISRIEAPCGDVVLSGVFNIDTISAKNIKFTEGQLNARFLIAQEHAVITGNSLRVDVLLAKNVELGNNVKGRVTVLESENETGPSQLKGCFHIDEYLEIFPSGANLIEQVPELANYLKNNSALNNIKSQNKLPNPANQTHQQQEKNPLPSGNIVLNRESESEIDVLTLTESLTSNLPDAKVDTIPTDPSEIDPIAIALQPDDSANEATYSKLYEHFLKISACYKESKYPPPIISIEKLIEERRFELLRKQLTGLWNELLQYHKREGLHLSNPVTQNIQEIKKILQELF